MGRRPGRRGQRRWRSRPGRRTPWRWWRKGWAVNGDAYTSWTPLSCGLALLFAATGVANTGMESHRRDMESRRREIWRLSMGGVVTLVTGIVRADGEQAFEDGD